MYTFCSKMKEYDGACEGWFSIFIMWESFTCLILSFLAICINVFFTVNCGTMPWTEKEGLSSRKSWIHFKIVATVEEYKLKVH